LFRKTFATDINQPAPHFGDPALMYKRLFGPLLPSSTGVETGPIRRKAVLDGLRTDINRLRPQLAGIEQGKLDQYLFTIEEFEQRAGIAYPLACAAPAEPNVPSTGSEVAPEDLMDAMTDMAIVALSCGMTRVVGLALGTGFTHGAYPTFRRIVQGTQWEQDGLNETGHSPPEVQGPAMELIHNYASSLLARIADGLSQIQEGDGTAFDNSVMVYMSDNGEAHHSEKRRWPFFVLGNAGGKLNADGRFIRYAPGKNSLADFYLTLSAALGVEAGDFAKGATAKVTGPLSELT
jgi:hypothetical protein